jgi:hypothetical protein
MRSFMERLMFPFMTYTDPPQSLFPGKIHTGLIYTMNVKEEELKEWGYALHLGIQEIVLQMIFGAAESLFCFDTYQFDDYSKVVSSRFDPVIKARRRKEVFPEDCRKAFEMGARFAKKDVR